MEELVLKKKNHHRKGSKAAKAAEPPKELTLEQAYLAWHTEQFEAMKDALTSAFGENYDIVKHEFATTNFYKMGKETTAENKAIVNRLLDIHEYQGELGLMRQRKAYTIIIHFPDLTVSNGGRSHPIQDMWVKIDLSAAFCASHGREGSTYFLGNRTTMSYAEITSEYSFSHLSGGWNPERFRDFCLGHTPFAFLCTDLCGAWDKDKFLMFCFQLEEYLSWESLDGGPYRTINDIRERNIGRSRGEPDISASDLSRYYKLLLASNEKIPVQFVKTPIFWGLKVKPGEEFDIMVTDVVNNPAHLSIYDPVTKRKTSHVVTDKEETINMIRSGLGRRSLFEYKGKPVRFTVTDQTNQTNTDVPMRACDRVVTQLMNTLNQRLLKETTSEYTR